MKINLKISLFAALLAFTACSHEEKVETEKVNYLATSPLQTDTIITKQYVSQIHSYQHIEIRALEKGYLEKIFVDEGQMVKKGQLMFQIMPAIYSAERQRTQAEADFVALEYKNTKQLFEKNVVSANELALAKAKLDKALAELRLAETHLKFTEIRAPFDGIMDHFQVRLGSLVNEGDLLTTLSDNSQMWVYFNVPEKEYLDYKTHNTSENLTKVNLKMANDQIFKYPGSVKTIEADFNNETGNIAFRATFPNPDGLLRHGETGNIQMNIPIKNAIIIPQKATFEVLEKKYVYVIDKQNKVHAKEVVIGSEMPDLYIITKGLSPSDKILVEGIQKVKENDLITFKFETPQVLIPSLKVYVE